MPDDYSSCCAPGATCRSRYIAVNEGVSLQVTTFTPPQLSPYPEIVFIPGWISLVAGWRNALIEMSRDFVIHYVETREKLSARTDSTARFGIDDFASDITAIVKALQLAAGAYILCGSSLGATAIIESYRTLPLKPRCLILIGVNARFYIPRFWRAVVFCFPPRLYLIIKPVVKWYLRTFRLDTHSDPLQYEKYCRNLETADPWKLRKSALAFARYTVWEQLPAIDRPTLLFSGSRDALHELDNIRRIGALLPHSTHIDLETNSAMHDAVMVNEVRRYLTQSAAGEAADQTTTNDPS